MKDIGEGATAVTPADVHATVDAFRPFGIADVEMSPTPETVWLAFVGRKRPVHG